MWHSPPNFTRIPAITHFLWQVGRFVHNRHVLFAVIFQTAFCALKLHLWWAVERKKTVQCTNLGPWWKSVLHAPCDRPSSCAWLEYFPLFIVTRRKYVTAKTTSALYQIPWLFWLSHNTTIKIFCTKYDWKFLFAISYCGAHIQQCFYRLDILQLMLCFHSE